jgi:Tfp pilus assembly protein PilW
MWTRLRANRIKTRRLRQRSGIAGVTVVEMVVVCALACVVILTSSAMLSQSIDTWSQSTSQTFSDDDCAIAMQRIQRDLQSALWIEIASDGQSVTRLGRSAFVSAAAPARKRRLGQRRVSQLLQGWGKAAQQRHRQADPQKVPARRPQSRVGVLPVRPH